MASARERLLQKTQEFLDSIPNHFHILSDDVTVHYGPSTLGTTTQNSKEELRQWLAKIVPTLENFKIWQREGTEPVVDIEARKVVVQARSRADTPVGEYKNEYVFIITFDRHSELVNEYWEWLDSEYTKAHIRKLEAAAADRRI